MLIITASLLIHADAGIHEAVDDIDQQVAEEGQSDIEHLQSQNNFIVIAVQCIDVGLTDTVQSEDVLDHEGTGENAQEPADNQGGDGQQRVAPGMGVDDNLLLEALGAGGADVVLVDGVQHGGSGLAGQIAHDPSLGGSQLYAGKGIGDGLVCAPVKDADLLAKVFFQNNTPQNVASYRTF